MPESTLPDDLNSLPEALKPLDRLAHITIIYLIVVALASFFVGAIAFKVPGLASLMPQALLGFAGSAIAALTSCLDRYANGFETEAGAKVPKESDPQKPTERFNRRLARWFFARPFLGAIVSPAFIWGLSQFSKEPEKFLSSPEMAGFTAFMVCLLAKSAIDLIKGVFKNVFKA